MSTSADEDDVLPVDVDCFNIYEEAKSKVVAVATILQDAKRAKKVRRYPWANERLPVDVDRNLSTVNILEVMLQFDFVRKEDQLSELHASTVRILKLGVRIFEVTYCTVSLTLLSNFKLTPPGSERFPLFFRNLAEWRRR